MFIFSAPCARFVVISPFRLFKNGFEGLEIGQHGCAVGSDVGTGDVRLSRNETQAQDSFRLSQKLFADRLVRAQIEKAALNDAIPTPSGMTLEILEGRLSLQLVDD